MSVSKRLARLFELLPVALVLIAASSLPGTRRRALPLEDPTSRTGTPELVLSKPGMRLRVTTTKVENEAVITAKDVLPAVRIRVFHNDKNGAYLVRSGVSDGAGVAAFESLPAGETWILADAPGRARASHWLIWTGEPKDVVLGLATEQSIDVDLVDDKGVPVAGEVSVTGDDPVPLGVRTDSKGHAHIGALRGLRFALMARAPGFDATPRSELHPGDRIVVTMQKLAALRVVVLDVEGKPAPSAAVQIASSVLWPPRTVLTDAQGTIRIGSLAAGSYALRATKGSLVSPAEVGLALAKGEEQSVQIKMMHGAYLSVLVIQEDGGRGERAVNGAIVTALQQGLSPFPLEAETGRNGRVRLGPGLFTNSTLSAVAPEFVNTGPMAIPEPLPGEMKLVLERGGVIAGRVTDPRGFPVAGATLSVAGTDFRGLPIEDSPGRRAFRRAHSAALPSALSSALSSATGLLSAAGDLGVMALPAESFEAGRALLDSSALGGPSEPVHAEASLLSAPMFGAKVDAPWATESDGTFRIEGVPAGRVLVVVRHPEYIDAESAVLTLAPAGKASCEVALKRGGLLQGRVLDDRGYPVAFARVVLTSSDAILERSQQTGTDGSFAFAAVPSEVSISVGRSDDLLGVLARQSASVPEGGKRDVVVKIARARESFALQVEDSRAVPVQGAQISVLSLDSKEPARTTVFTNARGIAHAKGVRGLLLRVQVNAPGFAAKTLTVQPTETQVRVALSVSEQLTGEVRSARGDKLSNVELALETETGTFRTTSASDGTYRLAGISAGTAVLKVRMPGYAPQSTRVVVPEERGRRAFEAPRIELEREATIEGTVVDERSEPLPGARVSTSIGQVYTAGLLPAGVVATDLRGRFRLGEMIEGNVVLDVYVPDYGRAKSEVVHTIAGQTSRDVRIVVKKASEASPPKQAAVATVAITLGESGEESEKNEVIVAAVAGGSGADRGGVRVNDTLVSVDEHSVHSMAEARKYLNGPRSQDVMLRVRRADAMLVLRVARDQGRR